MASRPPEHNPRLEGTARARFFIMNAVRLTGVALVIVGLLVIEGRIELPEVVGWVFLPVGLIEIFVVPTILARKWRTPPG